MKRWLALLLAAGLLVTGCSAQTGTGDKTNPPEGDAESTGTEDGTGPGAEAAYQWALEPTWEWTDVEPVLAFRPVADYDFNSVDSQTRDGLSVFYENEKMGLVDVAGNIVAEARFDSIDTGYGGRYLLENDTESFTLDENHQLVALAEDEATDIRGTAPNMSLCWVEDQQLLYVYGGGDTTLWDPYTGEGPVPAFCAETAQKSEGGGQWIDFGGSDIPCVLTDGVRPVTEVTYAAVGSFQDGLAAVQNAEGKWGYVDATGEEVFPCVYDTVYGASEGLVAVCQNNAWALFTTANQEVIPFGEFEALRPVYQGQLWACQEGKWGVLTLDLERLPH